MWIAIAVDPEHSTLIADEVIEEHFDIMTPLQYTRLNSVESCFVFKTPHN